MPGFKNFNEKINDIHTKFMKKNKIAKEYLQKRKVYISYHMHPNRRLKKFFYMYPYNPKASIEASVPFFTVSVNKCNKNNKTNFVCIYNNFYEGGIKECKLHFLVNNDDKSIKRNINEHSKVVKMIQYAYKELDKNLGKVDFYEQ